MSISHETVKKIAHLARISIQDEDIPVYAEDMSNIFALVAELSTVDTTDIAPLAHPLKDIPARLRKDIVTEQCEDHHLQNLTPFVEDDLYLVPKVIEE